MCLWVSQCFNNSAEAVDSLDLATHGEGEQGNEVHQEDRPVHRHVGRTSNGAEESKRSRLGGRVPELEFCMSARSGAQKLTRKTADERPELLVLSAATTVTGERAEEALQTALLGPF